ncbi:MAG: hypothetical protein ACTHKF_03095 [Candidatus Nitrosocosmicus sp.]
MGNNAPSTTGLSPNYAHIFNNNDIGQNGLGLVENNPGYGKYITNVSNGKPFNYSIVVVTSLAILLVLSGDL